MAEQENGQAAAENQAPEAQFALQRIYLKDASFEAPGAPQIFQQQWQPKINLDINTRSAKLGDDLYEVVLSLTVTATMEDKTAFLVEVQQAGIFKIAGLEGPQLHQTIGSFCPNLLFPYAREAIDNMVLKASFPPLMLAPVNFDAIYAQSLQKRAEAEAAKTEDNSEATTH